MSINVHVTNGVRELELLGVMIVVRDVECSDINDRMSTDYSF